MSRSLVALWLTLVAAIITIVMLAIFWSRQRTENAQQRVRDILQSQLEPYNDSIGIVIADYSIALQRELANRNLADPRDCVDLTRSPLVHAVTVVDRELRLQFPRDANLSADRQSLVDEALQLLREHIDPEPVAQSAEPPKQAKDFIYEAPFHSRSYTAQSDPSDRSESAIESVSAIGDGKFGWITWYHRRGIVLGFWWQQSDAWRAIVVLPRARWMADLVAALPESGDGSKLSKVDWEDGSPADAGQGGSLKQLIDIEGNLIYQWGDIPADQWDDLKTGEPDAELPLAEPLEGWRLRVFATKNLRDRLAGDDAWIPLLLAVVGVSVALISVGALVTVTLHRQVRLAARRVSFVNQVSHELRTPLTNICMYADMLAQSLEGEHGEITAADAHLLEKVAVIQSESQRLGRLIGNVLLFARPDSKHQELRFVPAVLDEVVRDVVSTFRPRLERLGFEIRVNLETPQSRYVDPDAVEQILVNLIGNAEKYAAVGKRLEISTKGSEDSVEIQVEDAGPGIPSRFADKIFAPFVRLSDRLEYPTGTGIGLTIARRLAREHGGDCALIASGEGACFRCTLRCPIVSSPDSHHRSE